MRAEARSRPLRITIKMFVKLINNNNNKNIVTLKRHTGLYLFGSGYGLIMSFATFLILSDRGRCFSIPDGPLPASYMQSITTSTTANKVKAQNFEFT